jgi:Fe2+ transport system protein FeoA
LLPLTLGGGADEDSVHTALFSLAKDNSCLEFRSGVPEDIGPPVAVLKSSVGRVMNQLVALGFIEGVPIHPAQVELCGEPLRTERARVVSWLLTLLVEKRILKSVSKKSRSRKCRTALWPNHAPLGENCYPMGSSRSA